MESSNILRQIRDIQVQADKLIATKSELNEIENFAKYSLELKTFLRENIDDDFILNYVNSIPDFEVEDEKSKIAVGLLSGLAFSFSGIFGAYFAESKQKSDALDIVRDIKGKYASLEFLLKNYFD